MDFMFIESKDHTCKSKVMHTLLKFSDPSPVVAIYTSVSCLLSYSKLGTALLTTHVETGISTLKAHSGIIFGNLITLSREGDNFHHLHILGARYLIFLMICVKNLNLSELKS